MLSSEHFGPVYKPPRLELSLLHRRGYLFALGGLRALWVVARVAWRTKRFWEDISPYSIASVHVALINGWKALPLTLTNSVPFNVRKTPTFGLVSFLPYKALAPLLSLFSPPSSSWEISSPPLVSRNKVPPPTRDYTLTSPDIFIMIILPVLGLLCTHSVWRFWLISLFSFVIFLESTMRFAFTAWMCVCICLFVFLVLDTLLWWITETCTPGLLKNS